MKGKSKKNGKGLGLGLGILGITEEALALFLTGVCRHGNGARTGFSFPAPDYCLPLLTHL